MFGAACSILYISLAVALLAQNVNEIGKPNKAQISQFNLWRGDLDEELRMDHVGWYPVLRIQLDGKSVDYEEVKDILEVRMEVAGTSGSSQIRPQGTDLI